MGESMTWDEAAAESKKTAASDCYISFDTYIEAVNATCDRDIYGHADYRLSDMRAAFMAGADSAKNLPLRLMFDEGFARGRVEGIAWAERFTAEQCAEIASDYHRRDPVHFIACAISDAIKEKFGLEI